MTKIMISLPSKGETKTDTSMCLMNLAAALVDFEVIEKGWRRKGNTFDHGYFGCLFSLFVFSIMYGFGRDFS